jgi:hypothetical protein
MLNYDLLVAVLESTWETVGFHEHELIESIQPDTLDRSYKADLFPEHPQPLDEEVLVPWVEINFAWNTIHELCSLGHTVNGKVDEPLGIAWLYNVIVRDNMREYSDQELVRVFHRCVQSALSSFVTDLIETPPIAVEIRRVYHTREQLPELVYVHLVSPNFTDLTEFWTEHNPQGLHDMLLGEFELAHTVIQSLSETFTPAQAKHPNRPYQPVDTA